MQWKTASPFEFEGRSIETKTKRGSEFPNGETAPAEQLLGSDRNKYTITGLWESTSGIW